MVILVSHFMNCVDCKAETYFNKAIALKPDYALAGYNLGVLLSQLGRLAEAEAAFKQVLYLILTMLKLVGII